MNWIPMLDYSLRHRVSLSTLRRRIKSRLIEFKKESGRYLIKEIENSNNATNSSIGQIQDPSHALIQELKKAYGAVLSEKEEMIAQIKTENEDLRKINSLLEHEIDRLSSTYGYRPKDL